MIARVDMIDFVGDSKTRSLIYFKTASEFNSSEQKQRSGQASPSNFDVHDTVSTSEYDTFDQLYNLVTERMIAQVIETE